MVKPRLHVSVPQDIYEYAVSESEKFNDSMSALITYCLYLYKSVHENIERTVPTVNVSNIPMSNIKVDDISSSKDTIKLDTTFRNKENTINLHPQNSDTSTNINNSNTDKFVIDEDTNNSIDNILNI